MFDDVIFLHNVMKNGSRFCFPFDIKERNKMSGTSNSVCARGFVKNYVPMG